MGGEWHDGFAELRAARAGSRGLLAAVAVFSVAVNLLALTGPLFMLQVYDRVLASRSGPTLAALFLLVSFLFLMLGVIDLARSRVMARIALRLQDRLEPRVFQAALAQGGAPAVGLRDLDSLRQLLASPLTLALFDLPWAPLFLAGLYLFHPLLGGVATLGGLVLVAASWLNRWQSRTPLRAAAAAEHDADRLATLYRDEGELIGALGMRGASLARWRHARERMADAALVALDRGAGFTVFSRSFRLFLQSALLAAGAWLVLRHQLTPGAMIASSVLMGRALAPVDQLVAGWSAVQRALDGWERLGQLLSRHPPPVPRTPLPRPAARLEVTNLTLILPGQDLPALRGIGFSLAPGQALGVIGASGAGKSTLAHALIGAWPAAAGAIRLDGAALDQYDPDTLGGLIGYLPQRVTLFDGTVAENIARLSPQPDPAAVVRAAVAAGAHRMILGLPQGYDTPLSQAGAPLSGGQIQRIGLARALYGQPVLLVLDEPDSHLDAEGAAALNLAIRAVKSRAGAVVIMAHRPAAIAECELLLRMDAGRQTAFGPRDEVLAGALRSAAIRRASGGGAA
ncbi:type I secretion system permease/ATPase [Paracoccus sp. (in: a-proteobacteria)]